MQNADDLFKYTFENIHLEIQKKNIEEFFFKKYIFKKYALKNTLAIVSNWIHSSF